MQKMVKKQRQCIYARIQAYSLELTVAQHMRQPVGGVAAQASGLIGLENGRGPDEGPAGFENARHVPDQQVRILDMMKHLLTEDEVDAVIFIRQAGAVKDRKIAVGPPPAYRPARVLDSQPPPFRNRKRA